MSLGKTVMREYISRKSSLQVNAHVLAEKSAAEAVVPKIKAEQFSSGWKVSGIKNNGDA
jgi:hypothetical protein